MVVNASRQSDRTEAAPLRDALVLLREQRGDAVVITTMAAEREWLKISAHDRDFFYVPSSMGQAPALGLGVALARPELNVIVLNGDGCMLMNLGCLVTIAEQSPPNYRLVVINNGVYEVTGAQPVPGGGRVDFAAIARAAGFAHVFSCRTMADWKEIVPRFVRLRGPVFVDLHVQPTPGEDLQPVAPCPMPEQMQRFRQAIGAGFEPHDS